MAAPKQRIHSLIAPFRINIDRPINHSEGNSNHVRHLREDEGFSYRGLPPDPRGTRPTDHRVLCSPHLQGKQIAFVTSGPGCEASALQARCTHGGSSEASAHSSRSTTSMQTPTASLWSAYLGYGRTSAPDEQGSHGRRIIWWPMSTMVFRLVNQQIHM